MVELREQLGESDIRKGSRLYYSFNPLSMFFFNNTRLLQRVKYCANNVDFTGKKVVNFRVQYSSQPLEH